MGVVYRAFDTLIERDVALKILPEELAADPATRERFLAEARAAGRLTNPHVVARPTFTQVFPRRHGHTAVAAPGSMEAAPHAEH